MRAMLGDGRPLGRCRLPSPCPNIGLVDVWQTVPLDEDLGVTSRRRNVTFRYGRPGLYALLALCNQGTKPPVRVKRPQVVTACNRSSNYSAYGDRPSHSPLFFRKHRLLKRHQTRVAALHLQFQIFNWLRSHTLRVHAPSHRLLSQKNRGGLRA